MILENCSFAFLPLTAMKGHLLCELTLGQQSALQLIEASLWKAYTEIPWQFFFTTLIVVSVTMCMKSSQG